MLSLVKATLIYMLSVFLDNTFLHVVCLSFRQHISLLHTAGIGNTFSMLHIDKTDNIFFVIMFR